MILETRHVPTYRCPGEAYDIPYPVHVARMAAGYAHCRECPHRDGAARTQWAAGQPADASIPFPESRSLFAAEGVRGVYLNELTRSEAAAIAGAFASCLWDAEADRGGIERSAQATNAGPSAAGAVDEAREGITLLTAGRPGPTVVLAYDERPAGPDLVVGVGGALRRMGCEVIDVGPATRPAFWFAVRHLKAAGGVHVTGSGCDPAWMGMDFVGRDALPFDQGGELDVVEARYRAGYVRPSRRPGAQRLTAVTSEYEATLARHFHALRPLRISVGCPNRLLRELLGRLFQKVACRLIPVEVPVRGRRMSDADDPDMQSVARSVRNDAAHLGILIDDDAQTCALFDETGTHVPADRMLRLFAEVERPDHPDRHTIAVSSPPLQGGAGRGDPARPLASTGSTGRHGLLATGPEPSLAAMSRAMLQPDALCGGDSTGRFWFLNPAPTCDAVLTLVKLLHVLSRSDAPFSEVLR